MKTAETELDEALKARDDRVRPERIQRIIWLAEHENLPSAFVGRTETLHLLREAREVFVDGYYAAALLLAISVINHSLIEELQFRDEIQSDPGLQTVLARSESLQIIPAKWFAPIKQLVARRHPFVHFKDSDHKHGLGVRVMHEKVHPTLLLEQDARDAVRFMFLVFRATLREAA